MTETTEIGAAQTQIGHITEYPPRKDFFAKEVLLKEYIIIMSHHYKLGLRNFFFFFAFA